MERRYFIFLLLSFFGYNCNLGLGFDDDLNFMERNLAPLIRTRPQFLSRVVLAVE